MDWTQFFCTLCFATATVVAQQNKQSDPADDLTYCLPNLKGYLFENPVTQRCYEFVTAKEERTSWAEARDYCQLNGGRLINIENRDKQLMLELYLNSPDNTYKPNPDTYNPLKKHNSTWGDYDPDVWVGAMRDSDGSTWRFDQYATSRTVRSVIVTWFNYGTDPDMLAEQNAEKNRYTADTCLIMRFNYKNRTDGSLAVSYPWYQQQMCSNPKGPKHPYICEYEGYEYRGPSEASNWIIVIGVLAAFVSCGFFACAIYCLWDKIHTSYNVLQV